jgi:hypothetical protein
VKMFCVRVGVYVTERQPCRLSSAHVELLQREHRVLICSSYTYLADPELVRELCKFTDSCVFQKPFLCFMYSDSKKTSRMNARKNDCSVIYREFLSDFYTFRLINQSHSKVHLKNSNHLKNQARNCCDNQLVAPTMSFGEHIVNIRIGLYEPYLLMFWCL